METEDQAPGAMMEGVIRDMESEIKWLRDELAEVREERDRKARLLWEMIDKLLDRMRP